MGLWPWVWSTRCTRVWRQGKQAVTIVISASEPEDTNSKLHLKSKSSIKSVSASWRWLTDTGRALRLSQDLDRNVRPGAAVLSSRHGCISFSGKKIKIWGHGSIDWHGKEKKEQHLIGYRLSEAERTRPNQTRSCIYSEDTRKCDIHFSHTSSHKGECNSIGPAHKQMVDRQ